MKRIGMLFPSSGLSEEEVQKILPPGVSLHVTRMPLKRATYEEELHFADCVEEAAGLLADAGVDIIAFNNTLGSLMKGRGYDQEIIERIVQATGIPATTTITAVVAGLRALNVRKLILIAANTEDLVEVERAFLADTGFEVLRSRGLSMEDCAQEYDTEPSYWYEQIKKMKDSQADGYFISCGGIRIIDVIEPLEADLEKSVVTSNQALAWHSLRKIGVKEPLARFGRLLIAHQC